MAKKVAVTLETETKVIKKILISPPKPESEKSPYFDLEKKHNVELVFLPFIKLEGIIAKEFRKQKIDITSFTAVVFTSRNAIDHFFRMCDEMKITINQDSKYFCDGTNKSMFDVINKHKENERFLYVCSENQQDNDIVNWFKNHKCDYKLAFMYRSVSNDIKPTVEKNIFDVICFFTPSGVKSWFDNYPDFSQNEVFLGSFGQNTTKSLEELGFELAIKAPQPQAPSMVSALDKFLLSYYKKL
jgi:uroporphyrinogen-III synthase